MKYIKKCVKVLLLTVFIIPVVILLFGCGNQEKSNNLLSFSGIYFESKTINYDGNEHELLINGNIPENANVIYQNNKAINAGVYNAKAIISLEGYNTLELSAVLTINKLDYDMSNASWNFDLENAFTYDGTEKEVLVTNLPQGVIVNKYQNNKATNAGVYNASVSFIFDKVNYNTPTISNLQWEIKKADIIGITFKNKTIRYDGTEKEILVSGNLPSGASVTYTNNRAINEGTYKAIAIISCKNYNTLILNAELKILPDLSQLSEDIISKLLNIPDPWEFLPTSFSLENKIYTGGDIDFSNNFISVKDIPQMGIGKQMNVVYSTLLEVEDALSYLRAFYASTNTIVELYQNFINSNEDNYTNYETVLGDFTFQILLNDSDYEMTVNYKSTIIELVYIKENKQCKGKIQLTNKNVLRYEMSNNSLTIAVCIFDTAMTKLHFERDSKNLVNGYLYEFYGTEKNNIKTTALINVDKDYTSIISNKRESDDLVIEGYMEVYDNKTANLVGAQVKETVNKIEYDTKWYNLFDITGITNIKAINEQNGLNANKIYINNNIEPIKTKLVGGLSLKTASRRFDIEMKDIYFYTYNNEKEKYEKIKMNIPMLFVQNDFVESFTEDFNDKNNIESIINASISQNKYFNTEYQVSISTYLRLKDSLTYTEIADYIEK